MKTELNRMAYKVIFSQNDEKSVHWNGKPAIFYKIDWFTGIFENCSIRQLFNFFELDDLSSEDVSTFLRDYIYSPIGNDQDFVFRFNGINFFIGSYMLMHELHILDISDISDLDPFYVLDHPIPKIRLDITGSGLDYLRLEGIDVDSILSTPFSLPEGCFYHPTRADFAFDFIDFAPDFLDNCKDHCYKFQDKDTGRVPVHHGSVKWSSKDGDQNTLYLGSTGSDKLLRIYDKKFQFVRSGMFDQSCPYRNGEQLPSSWIRVELQTRRSESDILLYNADFQGRFEYIYDRFAMRSVLKDYGYQVVYGDIVPFWSEIFLSDDFMCISRIANFVQSERTFEEKAVNFAVGPAFRIIYGLAMKYGWPSVENMFAFVFNLRQRSSRDVDLRFVRSFKQYLLNINNGNYPARFVSDSSGIYSYDSSKDFDISFNIDDLTDFVPSFKS